MSGPGQPPSDRGRRGRRGGGGLRLGLAGTLMLLLGSAFRRPPGATADPPPPPPPALPPPAEPPPAAAAPGAPAPDERRRPEPVDPWDRPPVTRRRLTAREGWRLGLVAALLVLVGTGIGYASTLLMTTEYAARAQILYPLTEESPTGFLREDRSLTTQVVLLRSRRVLAPAAQANGLSVEELDAKLDASVVEGSEVLDLAVRDPDRATGLRLAEAVTARYLAVANDAAGGRAAYLRSQLAEVERRLDAGGLPPGQTAALAARRASLLDRLDDLELAGPQATLLTPPYSAEDPVRPRPMLAAAAGALSALLVAAALVFVLARRWTRR